MRERKKLGRVLVRLCELTGSYRVSGVAIHWNEGLYQLEFVRSEYFGKSQPEIRKTRSLRVEDLSRDLRAYTLLGVIVPPSA